MPAIPTAASSVSLTLAGVDCGPLTSVSGGGISAPVVEERTGGGSTHKLLGSPLTYEPLVVEVGLGGGADLYAWISSTWTQAPQRRDGAIVSRSANGAATSELQFFHALVTAVTVPSLDAASKDTGRLSVEIRPERLQTQPATNAATAKTKAKAWVCSQFRFDLDGVDTSHVSKIDAFTVVRAVVAAVDGGGRGAQAEPGALTIPNLTVTVAPSGAQAWQAWFQDAVIDGHTQNARTGALVFLAPDLKTELGRVTLHDVGICALRPGSAGHLVAELYLDALELHVGAAAPAPAPARPVLPRPPIAPNRPEPAPTPVIPAQ